MGAHGGCEERGASASAVQLLWRCSSSPPLCPSRYPHLLASSTGRPPTTSPRPPVLLQGATSALTNTMLRGLAGPGAAVPFGPALATRAAPRLR